MEQGFNILTRLDNIQSFQAEAVEPPGCPEGCAVLAVEGLAMSANTVTYAATADQFQYWRFFPAPQGYGRIPTWGIARVLLSRCDRLSVGAKVYGFLPLSSHLLVEPERIGRAGFVDGARHRQGLPVNYNRYRFVESDPYFIAGREPECAILRPLAVLSFLLETELHEKHCYGGDTVLVSSASSKAALATAYLATARPRPQPNWIGLTSPRNLCFVQRTGAYGQAFAYGDLEQFAAPSVTYVDFSGNSELRARVHAELGDRLRASIVVGATHWERFGASGDEIGPRPSVFFAPDILKARVHEWGEVEFDARLLAAFKSVLAWSPGWLTIDETEGVAALQSVLKVMLQGKADPSRGYFVRLGPRSVPAGGWLTEGKGTA